MARTYLGTGYTFDNPLSVADASGNLTSLSITNTGANGVSIELTGNGSTTPSKFLRVTSGQFQIINSAYTSVILAVTDLGVLSANGITSTPISGSTGSFTTLSASGSLTVANSITLGGVGNIVSSNAVYSGGWKYIATDFAWYFRSDGTTGDVVSLNVAPSGTAGAAMTSVPAFSVSQTGLMTIPIGLTVGSSTIYNPTLAITGAAGNQRQVAFQTAGVGRWLVMAAAGTESGSNTGSDFYIQALSDAGAFNGNPFWISRASGLVTMANGITASPISGSSGSFTTLAASGASTLTGIVYRGNSTFVASSWTLSTTTRNPTLGIWQDTNWGLELRYGPNSVYQSALFAYTGGEISFGQYSLNATLQSQYTQFAYFSTSGALTVATPTTLSSTLSVAGTVSGAGITSLLAPYALLAGATFSGNISAPSIFTSGASIGLVGLYTGGASNTGYVAFYNPSGTRQGYVGYATSGGYLSLESENGNLGYNVTGQLVVNGLTTANGGLYVAGNAGGIIPAAALGAALSWNYSNGSGEVDFWNQWSAGPPAISFSWYHCAGVGALSTMTQLATLNSLGAFSAVSVVGLGNGGGTSSAFLAQKSGSVGYGWDDTSQGTDAKVWDALAVSGTMLFRTVNDANSAATTWLSVTRSGYVPQVITLTGPTGSFWTAGLLTVNSGGLVVNAGGAAITGTTTVTGALNVSGISTLTGGINIGGAGAYYSSNLTYSGGWKYIASDYGAMLYFGGSNGTSLYVAPTGTAGATAAIVQAWNVTPAGAMTVYGPLTCAGTISAGTATFTGGLFVSGGTFAPGMLYSDGNWGMLIRGQTRAVDADLALCNGAGNVSLGIMASGLTTINTGLGFNSQVGANNTDCSKHIALWGTTFGFNVTASALNYTVSTGNAHYFNIGGTNVLTIAGGAVSVAGTLNVSGTLTAQYLRASTGAVSRTLASKLGDMFSALDFSGIDPTGATDSTTGIIAALAAMGNGTLCVPAGTFSVSGQINIAAGQYILGVGPSATIFSVTSATSDIFVFSPGTSGTDAGMSNFSITSTVTRTAGRYILDATVMNTQIHHFHLVGSFVGIEFADVGGFAADGLIYNSVVSTGVGIKISGGGDHYIDRILMDNPAGQPSAGILVTSSGGDWVTDCDLIRCGNGVAMTPGSGQTVEYMFFSQVCCDTCSGTPWLLQTSGTGTIYSIALENCWGSTGTSNGMVANGAGGFIDTVMLTNYRGFNSGQHGIYIENSVKNWRQIGGCISGNSTSTANTYDGINVAAGLVNFHFSGIHIGPSGIFADHQLHQIMIGAGAGDDITIIGNMVATANTAISMGATGVNCNVAFNPGYRTSNQGEVLLVAGTSSIAVSHGLSTTPGTWQVQLVALSNVVASGVTNFWVSAATSTTFTISTNATASPGLYFGWSVRVMGA
jgi:hypothetical protein